MINKNAWRVTVISSPCVLLGAILLLATVIFFTNLGNGSFTWDEARTAERSREILVFQDWLTIHWNYKPEFVKPPLYYWLTALGYQVLGVSEWTTRLWSALFGLLGVYAVYRLGTLVFSVRVGLLAAVILLTVPLYVEYARLAMLDSGLVSVGTLGLCAFLSNSPLIGWTLLGVGFLLKGPWIFFYLLPLPLWWWTQHRWESVQDRRFYLGFGIFLAIVLPWHVIELFLHGRAFFDSYVSHQVIDRIVQPLDGQHRGLLYYGKRLFDKWHVWTYWLLLGQIFFCVWQRAEGKKFAFLDLWILTVLLILTFLIQTTKAKYTMVCYPAVAVAVSSLVLYVIENVQWGKQIAAVSVLIAVIVSLVRYDFTLDFNPELKALGQVVQRTATESQSVVAFRTMQPVLVFYCQRPVLDAWNAEELLQAVQDTPLVILKKADRKRAGLEQNGFVLGTLYEGPKLILVTLRHEGEE